MVEKKKFIIEGFEGLFFAKLKIHKAKKEKKMSKIHKEF